MSTHSPWRPAQQRAMSESPKVSEELESPPRRWPMTLVAVVALLVGLGLGNTFGTSGRDLHETEAQLETRSAELQAAREEAEKVGSAYDRSRLLLASERRAGTVSDEGLEALARDLASLAGHPVVPTRSGAAGKVMRAWVDVHGAEDLSSLRAIYTSDATMTAVQNGVQLLDAAGARDVARAARTALPADLSLATPVLGSGMFAVAGYTVSGWSGVATGVMVVKVVDGRIARQWLFLDGTW